ncbi:cupin domain-containing protein [Altererythrobacter salegens]|uniref:Cupin domain-containing protein n=1 Tax=Croceibacterium salegens TaxID=1737568 RepID=A0A6I4SX47_9SPHN|nr:cupin domain-containing protein [Croceibacterium salegens]MXO60018.1 cupin domain-containing protein [Croceibacterium salegens]
MNGAINLAEKFALFDEHWSPRLAGRYNGNEIRLAKAAGDYHWHSHPDTDELFLVIEGQLEIDFRDRTASLGPGEMIVVPRGTEHRPRVPHGEVSMLVMDADGTPNTGDPATAKVVTAI